MKKENLLAILMLTSLFSVNAVSKPYYGGQLSLNSIDVRGEGASTYGVNLTLGTNFTDHIAIEGRLGLGLGEDTITSGNISYNVNMKNSFGLYGKYHFTPQKDYSLFALFGYSQVEAEVSNDSVSGSAPQGLPCGSNCPVPYLPASTESESESGISYGVGFKYNLWTIEYVKLVSGDAFDSSALNVGFQLKF